MDEQDLTVALHDYCSALLRTAQPHEPDNLLAILRSKGIVDG